MNLLLESGIRAVLMAAAVGIVIAVLRIANARARYAAWQAVLAAMLLLPAFGAWGPKVKVKALPAVSEAPVGESWIPALSHTAGAPAPAATRQLLAAGDASAPAPSAGDLLVAGYVLGAGFLLIRLLLGAVRAASLRRRAVREQGFFVSLECACAITVGWLRPAVILPPSWREWPRAELDAVLTHEREHARRRDPLVQWFAALNRCVFWFHPLAWWLERKLAAIAEEACDAAALASGHHPQDYSEYLLRQARAIHNAGARVDIAGVSMGGGQLSRRIHRVLDARPVPAMSRPRATLGAVLCASVIAVFSACELGRSEKAAAGQSTMNELMHRRGAENRRYAEKQAALVERARTLTPEQARLLVAKAKESPGDSDNRIVLLRHYQDSGNAKDLNALRLWFIEHHPAAKIPPGNIDPRYDRSAYDRGKSLWLAHVKRSGASADIYQRAADFLEGGDKPLAEDVLRAGSKAHPGNPQWPFLFGRHYAQALLGSGEPLTEYNVFRVASVREAQSVYARSVRARLAESNDVRVLAQTAQHLLVWQDRSGPGGKGEESDYAQLARTYLERAALIEPDSELAQSIKARLSQVEFYQRRNQLAAMSTADVAKVSEGDRMLLALDRMRRSWIGGKVDDATAKARELLDLAGRNRNDPGYGEAVFEANIVLGKAALRNGKKKEAARYLLAAADAPAKVRIRRGDFEMNLPRALVDWGERSVVADFLERMAPKTTRAKQFQDWAAGIRKGINPTDPDILFAPVFEGSVLTFESSPTSVHRHCPPPSPEFSAGLQPDRI